MSEAIFIHSTFTPYENKALAEMRRPAPDRPIVMLCRRYYELSRLFADLESMAGVAEHRGYLCAPKLRKRMAEIVVSQAQICSVLASLQPQNVEDCDALISVIEMFEPDAVEPLYGSESGSDMSRAVFRCIRRLARAASN